MTKLTHAEVIENIGMMVAHGEVIDSEDVVKVKAVAGASVSEIALLRALDRIVLLEKESVRMRKE
ncbi:hypothetical protein [Bacillus thuringiensis]|uniref:hypothetical protein n=1 Tax=Bacillus thuringiensis TaxID=1428 RepID=UPI000BFC0B60|nr:hypothetical protein [Bacillus thuringiensis]PGM50476.1 hypothetical protein CN949_18070 [Bacillus thuringiensis]